MSIKIDFGKGVSFFSTLAHPFLLIPWLSSLVIDNIP
jgi:hypothetical protein